MISYISYTFKAKHNGDDFGYCFNRDKDEIEEELMEIYPDAEIDINIADGFTEGFDIFADEIQEENQCKKDVLELIQSYLHSYIELSSFGY